MSDAGFVRSLYAGALAGLAVDLSLYPLDTIKTRLQSREGFAASGGFKNVYRGMSSIALGSAPGSALFFVTYNTSKKFLPKNDSPLMDAFRASLGEIAACLVRVPTEVVKQRAQISGTQRPLRILKEIHRTRGFFGLYKGYISTVLREIPFSFIEFPIWEFLKRRVTSKESEQCSPLKSAACGSLAGCFAAGMTTPLDVVKTRVMLDRERARLPILGTLRGIVASGGVRALYAGVVPRSLWMGIGGFVFFFSYEFAISL